MHLVLGGGLNHLWSSEVARKWAPPELGKVKINIDGSWIGRSKLAGIVVVARDHDESVLWSWAESLMNCFCSSEVEGKALVQGMVLARRMHIKEAIFETDSVEMYKAVTNGIGVSDWCESWLQSALVLLRRNPCWRLCFSHRESNGAADRLAFRASSQWWKWTCTDDVPLYLADVL